MAEGLGLNELIQQLRAELAVAQQETNRPEGAPFFDVTGVTLEAHVVVTEKDAVKGGFDIKVITLGSTMAVETQRVHRVAITLAPLSEAPASKLDLPASSGKYIIFNDPPEGARIDLPGTSQV